MPCFMTGTAEGDANLAAQEANKKVTELTRLLCLTRESLGDALVLPVEVREWWEEHKKIDAKRKADEVQRAARTVKF